MMSSPVVDQGEEHVSVVVDDTEAGDVVLNGDAGFPSEHCLLLGGCPAKRPLKEVDSRNLSECIGKSCSLSTVLYCRTNQLDKTCEGM